MVLVEDLFLRTNTGSHAHTHTREKDREVYRVSEREEEERKSVREKNGRFKWWAAEGKKREAERKRALKIK